MRDGFSSTYDDIISDMFEQAQEEANERMVYDYTDVQAGDLLDTSKPQGLRALLSLPDGAVLLDQDGIAAQVARDDDLVADTFLLLFVGNEIAVDPVKETEIRGMYTVLHIPSPDGAPMKTHGRRWPE